MRLFQIEGFTDVNKCYHSIDLLLQLNTSATIVLNVKILLKYVFILIYLKRCCIFTSTNKIIAT